MAIILMGKTATGKTTIRDKLIERGFIPLVTYTSRPPRPNEVQDVTYHYITKEDFLNKIEQGFFAEWKSYDTEEGTWYYGTAMEDLIKANNKTIIILTPGGYRDIKDILSNNSKSILIYSNLKTIRERLNFRGDNKEEIERRIKHDIKDFKGVENEVDKIVYNNQGDSLDKVVDKIINFVE